MNTQNIWRFLVENNHFNGRSRRGTQRIFRFPNGFGASVVKWTQPGGYLYPVGSYGASQGRYELAVVGFESEDSWEIDYSTQVTSDVLGWLSAEEVEQTLQRIANLWIV